jgi:deoxyribodipyrimidine photo-lyase
MSGTTAVVWLRRDLRLADNPALLAASQNADSVVPLYVHNPIDDQPWAMGSASRWWLHHSLQALDESLAHNGSRLIIRQGDELEILTGLINELGATHVFWNRLYEPAEIARDSRIKQALRDDGIRVETFNSALLNEPWQIQRPSGEPYRVFTPYWKAVQAAGINQPPLPPPDRLPPPLSWPASSQLENLELLPKIPWDTGFYPHWQPGEQGACASLERFITNGLRGYKLQRDIPGHPGTSRLSPHLRFGEISPQQVIHAIVGQALPGGDTGSECYIREIAWREFAHHLLFHFPDTANRPLDTRFERLAWRLPGDYAADLRAWQQGMTGYPIVDAGMRELWATGWMHNRVRMIVASLLTKNLMIPWQEGARWFWNTLVDADLANNTLGWQWTAGCGADAAPFFRIFNPVLQGEKFDPKGEYVRRWIPELARLPDSLLHKPWLAASSGASHPTAAYPPPIVDLPLSRQRALDRFADIKTGSGS